MLSRRALLAGLTASAAMATALPAESRALGPLSALDAVPDWQGVLHTGYSMSGLRVTAVNRLVQAGVADIIFGGPKGGPEGSLSTDDANTIRLMESLMRRGTSLTIELGFPEQEPITFIEEDDEIVEESGY